MTNKKVIDAFVYGKVPESAKLKYKWVRALESHIKMLHGLFSEEEKKDFNKKLQALLEAGIIP